MVAEPCNDVCQHFPTGVPHHTWTCLTAHQCAAAFWTNLSGIDQNHLMYERVFSENLYNTYSFSIFLIPLKRILLLYLLEIKLNYFNSNNIMYIVSFICHYFFRQDMNYKTWIWKTLELMSLVFYSITHIFQRNPCKNLLIYIIHFC